MTFDKRRHNAPKALACLHSSYRDLIDYYDYAERSWLTRDEFLSRYNEKSAKERLAAVTFIMDNLDKIDWARFMRTKAMSDNRVDEGNIGLFANELKKDLERYLLELKED